MKLAFLVNPLAGIGGSVALKGSDGEEIVKSALSRGAIPQANNRAKQALQQVCWSDVDIERHTIYTASADMGEATLGDLKIPHQVVYQMSATPTAEDTRLAMACFTELGVDLIVFAGGDGTARDILDALASTVKDEVPVIGVPAGVKIHSGVYAVAPKQAGELLSTLLSGDPMSVHQAMVMDLDEEAFRHGSVKAKCYGYLSVPVDDTRMQLTKEGGVNHEAIAVQDIATEVIENLAEDVYYLVGSGSTTAEIMQQLNLPNTLLGIDVVFDSQLIASDVSEQEILALTKDKPVKIIVTTIGGQGHIFGRGNQQLSASVITQVGVDNIIVIATNEKLRSLNNRSMVADTGDIVLDQQLSGLISVITGYQQRTLYQLN